MRGRNVRGIASFICNVGAGLSDTVCHADFPCWTSGIGDRPDLHRGVHHSFFAHDHCRAAPRGEFLVDFAHQPILRMDLHWMDYRAGLGVAGPSAVWIRVGAVVVLQSLVEVFCDGIERPAV
jgi:hypothetical protein